MAPAGRSRPAKHSTNASTIQASDVVLACSVRPRAGKATLRAMLDTTISRTLRHSTARTSQRRR
jgi:hypothetical protein